MSAVDARVPKPLLLARSGAVATGLIAVAVLLRLVLIAQGWPHLNSDEGVLGLMARHIAYRGDHPVFEYGQSYMSAVEAYLAAGFFHLFGPSLFALRLGLVILFALFLAAIYALAVLLYSRPVGLLSVAVLALGSHDVLFRQLEAEGGIQEMLPALALALFLASYLLIAPDSQRQSLIYLGFGLTAGLALYFDPFCIPFLIAALAVLGAARFANLRRRAGWLVGGSLLGLAPALLYNLTSTRRWATLLELAHRSHGAGTSGHSSFLDHLAGTVLVALPDATGGSGVCSLEPRVAYPISSGASSHVLTCTVVHGAWSLAIIGLWTVVLVLEVRAIWWARRRGLGIGSSVVGRHAARLVLIAGSGVTLLAYLVSAASATNPWGTQRYLSGLWIAVPALVAPLLMLPEWTGRRSRLWRAIRVALVVTLFLWLVAGTLGAYAVRGEVADNRWADKVVADLEQHRLTHFYTDYWTCYRLAFLSQEHLACRVLSENLRPGWDRNPPASRIVERDVSPAYVFPGKVPWITTLASRYPKAYSVYWLDGYFVYRPRAWNSLGSGVQALHLALAAPGLRRSPCPALAT